VRLSDFDYDLPKHLIAQRPLAHRDASKMLVLDAAHQTWKDHWFRDLPELLRGDELLVCNNARVIPARLLGYRVGVRSEPAGKRSRSQRQYLTSQIEILLIRQLDADIWEALVRPGRKMRIGERVVFGTGEIEAEVIDRGRFGLRRIRLRTKDDLPVALERIGHMPLPPYIDRPDEEEDRERYQTIFARRPGAIAAPTAGLHFTPRIVQRLKARGVRVCEITLQVGLGTFQPIRTDEIDQHRMHAESYEIPEATAVEIQTARREGRAILAVGTTVVRALEDAAAKSVQCASVRSPERAKEFEIASGPSETNLFIYPGHSFRVVDQLLTNFHLPKSSLLVMVAAFAGQEFLLRAYQHAVEQEYRFYSYGDCMLIR